jgi:hypothetical protein
VEKHEFCFDAVLDEHVSNDEVWFFLLSIQAVIIDFYCGIPKRYSYRNKRFGFRRGKF